MWKSDADCGAAYCGKRLNKLFKLALRLVPFVKVSLERQVFVVRVIQTCPLAEVLALFLELVLYLGSLLSPQVLLVTPATAAGRTAHFWETHLPSRLR